MYHINLQFSWELELDGCKDGFSFKKASTISTL